MTSFVTPVGRLVQGDCYEAQTKNMQGQPLVTRSGNPTQKFFIAVAFPKNDPGFAEFYAQMVAQARADFPQFFNAKGECTHPKFAWKIMDGDGIDDNGKPNANKTGFAGHWVVKFSTIFAPQTYAKDKYDPMQMLPPGSIKRGYFVRVAGDMAGNGDPNKPGLYLNQKQIELTYLGDEIVSGPDAAVVFGGAPAPAMPAGAIATPIGFAGSPQSPAIPPGVGWSAPMPTPTATVAVAPAPAVMQPARPAAMPSMPASPTSGFAVATSLPAPAQPAATIPTAPNMGFVQQAATPQYVMTAAAAGYTREQLIASGWTDQQLVAQGLMIAQ